MGLVYAKWRRTQVSPGDDFDEVPYLLRLTIWQYMSLGKKTQETFRAETTVTT
jgi:hypothetical protein